MIHDAHQSCGRATAVGLVLEASDGTTTGTGAQIRPQWRYLVAAGAVRLCSGRISAAVAASGPRTRLCQHTKEWTHWSNSMRQRPHSEWNGMYCMAIASRSSTARLASRSRRHCRTAHVPKPTGRARARCHPTCRDAGRGRPAFYVGVAGVPPYLYSHVVGLEVE